MPLLPQIHPVLASLPPVDSLTLEAVTQDMRSKGQHLPIVLYEGMLWDGRARLAACRHLGIKPWLVPLRRKDPMNFYVLSNYERCGGPRSDARNAVIAVLERAGSPEGRTDARMRRASWIKDARAEFKEFVRQKPEPCVVCRKYIQFVHAHHSFPLSLQFECGVSAPIHDYQWLCPVHHKYVHVILSGRLGSRDLSFLDCISHEDTEEWFAIEASAGKGIELCCEALGRVAGSADRRRYDPEYGLFLLNNPSVVRSAMEWKQSHKAA